MSELSGSTILCCDIDNTLVPIRDEPDQLRQAGYEALDELTARVRELKRGPEGPFYFGSATGRSYASHTEYEEAVPAFGRAADEMYFKITSVGTVIHAKNRGGVLELDTSWPSVDSWESEAIQGAMSGRTELRLQPQDAQGPHKISFEVSGVSDNDHQAYVGELRALLARRAIQGASIAFSGGQYLDFIPEGVNKGSALQHLGQNLHPAPEDRAVRPRLIAAGDSMNDCNLLEVADFAVLPGNAHQSLRGWAENTIDPSKLYIAEARFAAGVLEGLAWALSNS